MLKCSIKFGPICRFQEHHLTRILNESLKSHMTDSIHSKNASCKLYPCKCSTHSLSNLLSMVRDISSQPTVLSIQLFSKSIETMAVLFKREINNELNFNLHLKLSISFSYSYSSVLFLKSREFWVFAFDIVEAVWRYWI